MWARVVEVMLGCWLAISPFVFRHPAEEQRLWINDLGCALAVVALALFSFWPRTRHAHLALVAVGLWLLGFGRFSAQHPAPPALQNDLLVGFVLMMFALVPNEASLPPGAWREFYARRRHGSGAPPT